MGVRAKLMVAFGASGLAGALLLGASWVDRGVVGAAADALCSSPKSVSEAAFYSEIRQANGRMHAGMDIQASGNIDRDFARMMIPHHQGAIDMALLQLKYGGDVRLKRLAQSIIVEQGQEIAYLRTLLDGRADPASGASGIAGR